MGEEANDHIFLDLMTMENKHSKEAQHCHRVGMGDDDEDDDGDYGSASIESSSMEDYSTNSNASSSSSDLVEDASSLASHPKNGPLYDLSELVTQLPIKRGLSKFYQGKSQSHTSLASVKSIKDLPKKENLYRSKMKLCKSYDGGLERHNRFYGPKPTISKKVSRGSLFSSMGKRGSLVGSCRPSIRVQGNF